MINDRFNSIVKAINNNKSSCFFIGEQSDRLIELSENALRFKFSNQYRKFVKKYGAGSIGSQEVYGVTNNKFDNAR